MHIGVLAFNFPPAGSSGTYRGLALANTAANLGHEVTTVTCDELFWYLSRLDLELLEGLNPKVQIEQVSFTGGPYDRVINRWPKEQLQSTQDRNEQFTIDNRNELEPQFHSWVAPLQDHLLDSHTRHPFDLVIATGNPYATYFGAQALFDKAHVPYVLDDRDAWMFDVVTGEERTNVDEIAAVLEPLMLNSIESWFVNPPISNWYRNRFADCSNKIYVVENGWDAQFLNPQAIQEAAQAKRNTAPIFSYIGVISGKLPLRLLVDAWILAKQSGLPSESEFRLYGPLGYYKDSSGHSQEINDGQPHGVRLMGAVSKTQVQQAYEQTSVLVLAREGDEFVTSGKVYEYAATGLPIVGAVSATHDAHRVLADYPRTHIPIKESATEISPEMLAQAFLDAWEDSTNCDQQTIDQALVRGKEWERSNALSAAIARVARKAETQC